jgi:hypothetical protein
LKPPEAVGENGVFNPLIPVAHICLAVWVMTELAHMIFDEMDLE